MSSTRLGRLDTTLATGQVDLPLVCDRSRRAGSGHALKIQCCGATDAGAAVRGVLPKRGVPDHGTPATLQMAACAASAASVKTE